MDNDNNHVFISYSRSDQQFTKRLHKILLTYGKKVWVDWEGIPPSAEWLDQIQQAIRSADAVIFIISPDSISSETCRKEIEYADLHNKKVIPILYRDIRAESAPISIRKLNWISWREEDHDENIPELLISAIDKNLDWVRSHSRLELKASEWNQKGKNRSFLLRGKDLKDALLWVQESSKQEPQATQLQIEYISKSRRAEKNRNITVLFSLGILFLISILAILLYLQVQDKKKETLAQQLSNKARLAINRGAHSLTKGVLYAVASLNVKPTAEGRHELERGLRLLPAQPIIDKNLSDKITALAFNSNSNLLLAGTESSLIQLWDVSNKPVKTTLSELCFNPQCIGIVRFLQFSPDNKYILAAGASVRIWRVEDQKIIIKRGISHAVAVSPNFDVFAIGDADGGAAIWDATKGKHLAFLSTEGGVWSLAFSTDGQLLASGDSFGNVKLWHIPSGEEVTCGPRTHKKPLTYHHQNRINTLTFRPTGGGIDVNYFASGSGNIHDRVGDFSTRVWYPCESDSIREYIHEMPVNKAMFSHDGKRIYSISADEVVVYPFEPHQTMPALMGNIGAKKFDTPITVTDAAINQVDYRIALGIADEDNDQVIMLDENAKEIRLFALEDTPNVIAFSFNGKYIASGSESGNLKVWDLTEGINQTEDLVQEACARIPQKIRKTYIDIGLPADPCDSGNSTN
jgi:WD40 repeat protein